MEKTGTIEIILKNKNAVALYFIEQPRSIFEFIQENINDEDTIVSGEDFTIRMGSIGAVAFINVH